jgi:cytochrome c oxidase accessory protein FixG
MTAVNSRQTTVGDSGQHIRPFSQSVQGVYQKNRRLVAWFLFIIFATFPWIKLRGVPVFLLDIYERKIILFGSFFWPQDIGIFFPLFIAIILSVFLITALFGRIWCGWACPQTTYLHFLFEPIENFIVGSAAVRKKESKKELSRLYTSRIILKHILFFLVSLLLSLTFLAYFMGIDHARSLLLFSKNTPATEQLFLIVITVLFYIDMTLFKEQVCTIICPYARFQSVLTDANTLLISYNKQRGEPRRNKQQPHASPEGHCVNCLSCIRVCPTGIDIRNGNQLECIGCAKCIDACDKVMERKKYPKKLISYRYENSADDVYTGLLRPRIFIYSALIIALLLVFFSLLATRSLTRVDISRNGTAPYYQVKDSIYNIFSLRIRNKSIHEQIYQLENPEKAPFSHNWGRDSLVVPGGTLKSFPLSIHTSADIFKKGKYPIELQITNKETQQTFSTTLLGSY